MLRNAVDRFNMKLSKESWPISILADYWRSVFVQIIWPYFIRNKVGLSQTLHHNVHQLILDHDDLSDRLALDELAGPLGMEILLRQSMM